RKAEAAASIAAPGPVSPAIEAIEDQAALGLRDARPTVRDNDRDVVAVTTRRHLDCAAVGRVLGGIREQVGQDLLNAAAVALDRRHRVWHQHADRLATLLEQVRERRDAAVDERRRIEWPQVKLEAAGVETAQIEQVAHQ